MNWRTICIVGFKVLTAVVAGAAVFAGIQNSIKENNRRNLQPGEDNEKSGESGEQKRSSGEIIVNGLRATGDTCGKIIGFVSSLAGVIENGSRIFGKGGYDPYYDNTPWNSYYPGNYGYVNGNNGETLVRRSQFIVEAVPRRNGPYMNDNRDNYPF